MSILFMIIIPKIRVFLKKKNQNKKGGVFNTSFFVVYKPLLSHRFFNDDIVVKRLPITVLIIGWLKLDKERAILFKVFTSFSIPFNSFIVFSYFSEYMLLVFSSIILSNSSLSFS